MRIGMDFGTTNSGVAHYGGARLPAGVVQIEPLCYGATVITRRFGVTDDVDEERF